MEILSTALGYVMNFCYKLLHDYGLAIILFTLNHVVQIWERHWRTGVIWQLNMLNTL